jgi:hypothetical protein
MASLGGGGIIPDTWDYEADVVIVGFGGAGSAAAHKACELGAEVLILEKMSEQYSGGDTCCCAGMLTAGKDPEEFIESSNYTMSEASANALSQAVDEAYDWAVSTGLTFYENIAVVEGGAPILYQSISRAALESGANVLYETPATELIQDPVTKEIKGVYASQNGSRIAVKARKGVLLCCGDYMASPELMSTFHFSHLVQYSGGSPAITGDGIIMANAVGAKLTHTSDLCIEWGGLAIRKAGDELGTGLIYAGAGGADVYNPDVAFGTESRIFVNYSGERFMDEYAFLNHTKTTKTLSMLDITGAITDSFKEYVNLPMFLVMDSTCFNAGPLIGTVGGTWFESKGIYSWSADNQAELQKGWIVQADTLDELAAKMTSKYYMTGESVTVPADALKATVEKYNAGCAAGTDEFNRTAIAPMTTSPYYAAELCLEGIYTLGALAGDEKARVLNWSDEPIPRLYRCGNTGQGTEWMPIGVGGALGHGFMAAADVVTLDAWDEAQ